MTWRWSDTARTSRSAAVGALRPARQGGTGMPSAIKFGTDGWRAIIAEDYTFANVRTCAQAFAEHLQANGQAARGVVVGYDTRFASERFADATAEVLAANGIRVLLSDRVQPTPVISFAILD